MKSQQYRIELMTRPEAAASTQSAMVTSSVMTSLFLDGLLLLQGTNPIELGPGLVEDETAKSWSKETVLKSGQLFPVKPKQNFEKYSTYIRDFSHFSKKSKRTFFH